MEYVFLSYETGKKQGNKKRVVLCKGEEVPVLVHSSKGLGTPWGGEHTHLGTSPRTKYGQ
jgi:hypothetical protein